jgi:hypothetical protein
MHIAQVSQFALPRCKSQPNFGLTGVIAQPVKGARKVHQAYTPEVHKVNYVHIH